MQLYNHQQKIIDDDPKKTGLFLSTGSGKTRIALLLAIGKTLVICPKTQKEDGNWEREVKKLKLKIQLDTISKETFRRDHEKLSRYDTVICEEAHTLLGVTPNVRYKNKQAIPKTSQLYEALELFLDRTKPERLYLVTATIIKNPMTVWGAGKLLGKNWNFYEWRMAFYTKIPIPGREVWIPKKDDKTKDRLAEIVRKLGYIGRLEDFFDVPEQTYHNIYIGLTEKQKKRINELKLEYPDPIVLIGKKHQIENGTLKGDEFSKTEYFDNEKIEKLSDLALEFPKMIIFAKYTAQIEQIATAMKSLGKKVFILQGDTKNRGELILEANKSDEYVFIAQAQVSAGWELPTCPVMVFASRTYSFVDYVQAQGRIHRSNNLKRNLYINLIVKGGIDEAVDKSLENKVDFDEHIYYETSRK